MAKPLPHHWLTSLQVTNCQVRTTVKPDRCLEQLRCNCQKEHGFMNNQLKI